MAARNVTYVFKSMPLPRLYGPLQETQDLTTKWLKEHYLELRDIEASEFFYQISPHQSGTGGSILDSVRLSKGTWLEDFGSAEILTVEVFKIPLEHPTNSDYSEAAIIAKLRCLGSIKVDVEIPPYFKDYTGTPNPVAYVGFVMPVTGRDTNLHRTLKALCPALPDFVLVHKGSVVPDASMENVALALKWQPEPNLAVEMHRA